MNVKKKAEEDLAAARGALEYYLKTNPGTPEAFAADEREADELMRALDKTHKNQWVGWFEVGVRLGVYDKKHVFTEKFRDTVLRAAGITYEQMQAIDRVVNPKYDYLILAMDRVASQVIQADPEHVELEKKRDEAEDRLKRKKAEIAQKYATYEELLGNVSSAEWRLQNITEEDELRDFGGLVIQKLDGIAKGKIKVVWP